MFEDYVKLYGNRPLKFEPGEASGSISNYGFLLLGLVVEEGERAELLRLCA